MLYIFIYVYGMYTHIFRNIRRRTRQDTDVNDVIFINAKARKNNEPTIGGIIKNPAGKQKAIDLRRRRSVVQEGQYGVQVLRSLQ